MKIKTADLIGPALDWAVAKCESVEVEYINDGITRCLLRVSPFTGLYRPTVDWSQGGPIIERKGINLSVDYQDDALSNDMVPIGWKGNLWNNSVPGTAGFLQWAYGPTPLIAAMRCYVASRLGDEVDVPEELL